VRSFGKVGRVHPVIRIAGTSNGLAHHKTYGYHQIDRVIWHIDIPDCSEINFEVIVMAVNTIHICGFS
jgi:hypothetical protein